MVGRQKPARTETPAIDSKRRPHLLLPHGKTEGGRGDREGCHRCVHRPEGQNREGRGRRRNSRAQTASACDSAGDQSRFGLCIVSSRPHVTIVGDACHGRRMEADRKNGIAALTPSAYWFFHLAVTRAISPPGAQITRARAPAGPVL